MKQPRNLGVKSSNQINVICGSVCLQPESSNRNGKSAKSNTAVLRFITVTVLIYEKKVALFLPSSKNKTLQDCRSKEVVTRNYYHPVLQ